MKGSISSHHHAHQAEVHMQRYIRGMCATEVEDDCAGAHASPGDDVSVSVLWLPFTSSTSDLGDGGASTDHEHQQQCNTVPLALQGVE